MAVNTALEKFTLEHPRRRYEEKLGLNSFFDPFLLPSMGSASVAAPVSLPPVEASNIVAYLVLQTSFLTTKQFKARKSLDTYNQFINGWVKDVGRSLESSRKDVRYWKGRQQDYISVV